MDEAKQRTIYDTRKNGIMSNGHVRVEAVIGGKKLVLETGEVARQAAGAVVASLDETMVFAAVVVGPEKAGTDFFPLTCDYREKTEAAGKIPGGFFKREGRPTTKEILTMRLIDRSIRPMFPEGYQATKCRSWHTLSPTTGATTPTCSP